MTEIKPRWAAIEIEETGNLNLGALPQVSGFWTVYMFDRNEVTRICSQDKHYFLTPLYINVQFWYEVSDADAERIQGELSGEIGDSDYFLESDIEKMIANGNARIAEYGDLEEDETEDDVREYWQGNCPL